MEWLIPIIICVLAGVILLIVEAFMPGFGVPGISGIILLLAGVVPKFSAVLTTIPQCVIGGATISVFATITMTGIRMITEGGFTPRKSSVVGLSVALGVGITQVSGCLAGEGFPAWVNTVFGSSSVVVAALMAILLNLILPKEPSANG